MNLQKTAEKNLLKLENKFSKTKNKFIREHQIWMEIAMELNSHHTGKKKEVWGIIMDLYLEKYPRSLPKM